MYDETIEISTLIEPVVAIAKEAGKAILEKYHQKEPIKIKRKADQSPVTEADLASHDVIVAGLKKLSVQYPILSEEEAKIPFSTREQWSHYWLIDPLDGTKEFISRSDDFAINIALIENHIPILGVVYVPVTDEMYYASKGFGAFKIEKSGQPQTIKTKVPSEEPYTIVSSRAHPCSPLADFLEKLPSYESVTRGSALKVCLVAEGKADIYPRFGPTSEWDTAAPQVVIEEAGGALIDIEGKPFRYNTKTSLLNEAFLAVADPAFDWLQYT